MEINTVKESGTEMYLVNDEMYVPKADGNIHYKMIQEWIQDGGVVDPQYTAEELEAHKQAEINAEALRYLAETDWYVIRASEGGKAVPKTILTKRKKARLAVKRD